MNPGPSTASPSTGGRERREHPRVEVKGEVELVMASHVQRAALVDLSAGGACVRSAFAGGGWGDRVELRGIGATGRSGIRCYLVRVREGVEGVELGLKFDPDEARPRERVLELLGRAA